MTKRFRMCGWILIVAIIWCGPAVCGEVRMPDVMNDVCVGRLIVALPSDAKNATDANYHLIRVLPPSPASSFTEVVEKLESRAAILRNKKIDRDPYADKLAYAAGLDPAKMNGETQLLGFISDESLNQAMLGFQPNPKSIDISVEVHRYIDGIDYQFDAKSDGADQYPTLKESAWLAATQFRPLKQGTTPTHPGFCVATGMFDDDGRRQLHENFTLVATFKNHPDAQFTIDANAITSPDKNEPSLKFRVDSELGILRQNIDGHVAVLVRGERETAGQKGYQIGLSVPNDTVPGTTAYKFFWAADGVPNDVTRPFMEVQLTIQPDEDKPATITTAHAAKALWDELLQGIRIRPGSVRP